MLIHCGLVQFSEEDSECQDEQNIEGRGRNCNLRLKGLGGSNDKAGDGQKVISRFFHLPHQNTAGECQQVKQEPGSEDEPDLGNRPGFGGDIMIGHPGDPCGPEYSCQEKDGEQAEENPGEKADQGQEKRPGIYRAVFWCFNWPDFFFHASGHMFQVHAV